MGFLQRVWRLATKIDREAMVFARPARAALVSLLGLGILIGRDDVRSALPFGVGVLFTAMVDHGGALSHRLRPMVGTGIAITLGTGLGGLVSDGTWAHIVAGGILAVLCGYAGAAGPDWMFGGVLTLVVFTIFSGAPIELLAAGENAAWMGIGSVTLIVSMLLARAATHLARRRPVATVASTSTAAGAAAGTARSRAAAHLHWSDQYVLHAVRLAIVIVIAITLEELLDFPHSYWIPMTVAWITRPDLDGTVERVILRVVGTLVGIAFAGTFILTLDPGNPTSVLMSSLAVFIVLVFLAPNYAIAVVGITIFVFFLFNVVGYPPKQMIETRIVATLMAAALVAIAIHIGPRGEPVPVPAAPGPDPADTPTG